MARILEREGTTFSEYTLLPGRTSRECIPANISLKTELTDRLQLGVPFLTSAMGSVTGYELALAIGREGGMGVLPASLSIREQEEIVKRIKAHEMTFVDDPIRVRETATVGDALRMVQKYGHSKIPVVDTNNYFLGIFVYQHYLKHSQILLEGNVRDAMIKFIQHSDEIPPHSDEIPTVRNPSISVADVTNLFGNEGGANGEENKKYRVVLDDEGRLVKLAFQKDVTQMKIAVAIDTYDGWEERVRANIAAGVDLIVIDTSDAHNDFALDNFGVIRQYKNRGVSVPLCAGNVVTYEGAMDLMQAGVDIVKEGMSSGSICTTAWVKAVGRAPMTSLTEVARARDDYFNTTKRYVRVIADGGIPDPASMVIALTHADALMLGGWFNQFYEAAGPKFDKDGKPTTDETSISKVASWGEGSARAYNLRRYGKSERAFFPEGVDSFVAYGGRLKPGLKDALAKIRSAMSNAGCCNLAELRKYAVLERLSLPAQGIVKDTHHISDK